MLLAHLQLLTKASYKLGMLVVKMARSCYVLLCVFEIATANRVHGKTHATWGTHGTNMGFYSHGGIRKQTYNEATCVSAAT